MARTNVDDGWFSDPRRAALIRLVGDEFKADGMALAGWRLAQRYWKDDMSVIPDKIWKLSGCEPLIDCDLAERRDGGVYVRGSAEHFDWYLRKVEAGRRGGRRSGEARRDRHGGVERPTEADPKQTRSTSEAVLQQNGSTPEALLQQNGSTASVSLQQSASETNPPAPAPAPVLAPALSPLLPPSHSLQPRQGASRRDFDRDADRASAEVLRAIEGGWGADHMRRDLSTTAQLLIAKRWSSLAAFAETARVHRGPRDYEIFTSNLRRDFRALRQGLPAPPPSGDEEAKRKLDDMLEGGGGEHER